MSQIRSWIPQSQFDFTVLEERTTAEDIRTSLLVPLSFVPGAERTGPALVIIRVVTVGQFASSLRHARRYTILISCNQHQVKSDTLLLSYVGYYSTMTDWMFPTKSAPEWVRTAAPSRIRVNGETTAFMSIEPDGRRTMSDLGKVGARHCAESRGTRHSVCAEVVFRDLVDQAHRTGQIPEVFRHPTCTLDAA